MIIGKGLLSRSFASAFATDPDVTVFASGVSNSLETRAAEFERERTMLADALANGGLVVYFGSCGVIAAERDLNPYMRHKMDMESCVLDSPRGLVLRLPQVVGTTDNPHTLTNYIREKIVTGETFTIWSKAQRNLVDVDDIAAIGADLIRKHHGEPRAVSIASPQSLPMPDIVAIFERVLQRTARYVIEDKGSPLQIDASEAIETAAALGIDMGPGYVERVLRKYYSPQP